MLIGVSGKAQSGKDTFYKMLSYVLYYFNYYKSACDVIHPIPFSVEHMNKLYEDFDNLDPSVKKFSFANKLKECLLPLVDHKWVDIFENNTFKNSEVDWLLVNGEKITVRQLLQKFGTAIRDGVCADFWVQAAFANWIDFKDSVNVFTDVRFKTEAEAIKTHSGLLVRINRNSAGAGNHVSEVELDDYTGFDVYINNNGTIDEYLEQVRIFASNFNLI